jgi:hypothetical protein
MTTASWEAMQNYLCRLGMSEYRQGIAQHVKAGRSRRTYRHNPSEYHRLLVDMLGRGDEYAFKAEKMLRGDYSALGF